MTDRIFEIGRAYVFVPGEHPMSLVHTQGPKATAKFETVYLLFTTSSYFFVCGGGSRKSKCHQNKSFHCNSKKVRENLW